MNWTQIPLGPLQTNAYILSNDHNETIIVDPGGNGDALVDWLHKEKRKPIAILLTHTHYDHIGAVDDVRQAFNCPVYVHTLEQDWLLDPQKNGSARFGTPITTNAPADHIISEEGELTIGSFTFQLLETPGHSPGSISYYLESEGVVFSGDVLFAQGVGRTDLLGGSTEQIMDSIHHKLLELPDETIIACGHGNVTTVERVTDENPYLSGF